MRQCNNPFVIPFTMIGKSFLFDVNTNSVVNISMDLYNLLNTYRNLSVCELKERTSAELSEEIDRLLFDGYLKSNRVKEIEHVATPYIDSYVNNYLSKIVLQVTRACNMRCRYCGFTSDSGFDRNHGSEKMAWNTAKKAIDFLRSHSELRDHVEVSFYGGEPFLNFELIRKAVEYSEKVFAGKKLVFRVTTNGTVINDEIIDFVNKHNLFVCFSIDGPRNFHHKNRRYAKNGLGTFDDAIRNLNKMVARVNDYKIKISINSVIDPEENYHEYENFFNNEPAFDGIEIISNALDSTLLSEDIYLSSDAQLNNELEKLNFYLNLMSTKFSEIKSNLNSFNDLFELVHSFDRMSELSNKGHHDGPCFPGYSNLLITVDGSILPCEKSSELATCMYIGTLEDGFDYDKINTMLNIGKISEQYCSECPIIRHCKMCAKDINDFNTFDPKLKAIKCREQHSAFNLKLKKYVLLNETGILNCFNSHDDLETIQGNEGV